MTGWITEYSKAKAALSGDLCVSYSRLVTSRRRRSLQYC